MARAFSSNFALLLIVFSIGSLLHGADPQLISFSSQTLTPEYFSEGASAGDLNNDGEMDVVYGPHWYAGPQFTEKHEIYAPKPQNREGYADHFFAWVYDFNRDGWNDVFTVGFPGTPAYVYQNPGKGSEGHWTKHQVLDWVSNESPQWVNLVGDETPELVCTRDGFFGYATLSANGLDAWKFHPISEQIADKKFGHGLGVGDVNGDGRSDILYANGWFEQPKDNQANGGRWKLHPQKFTKAYGGAEMFAYDVDGDGDQDVITTHAAHDFGLAWYEQTIQGDERDFVCHDIMGAKPIENKYGVVFSELHSLQLYDMDGDGLKDIVTGKTYYSHHKKSPMWDTGAVVYWFKLKRTSDGVDWIPYRAADDTGIGRQVGLFDLNQDQLPDIVVGGMKGCSVLLQSRRVVDEATWKKAQPVEYVPTAAEKAELQSSLKAKPKEPVAKNQVGPWFEGESLKVVQVSGGSAKPQDMSRFRNGKWSENAQLWWRDGKPGDKLVLSFPVEKKDKYDLRLNLTKARDYAIVQLYLNDQKLGEPLDLFHPANVITTGLISFGEHELNAGENRITIELKGANSAAVKSHMVGLDALQLARQIGFVPKGKEGAQLNLDFETGTLADWTATGDAFSGQPIEGDAVSARRNDMRSQHTGKHWVGTFERNGDKPQGVLASKPFVVNAPFASMLVGGGESKLTRVEIVDQQTDKVLYQVSGENTENMRLVVLDLTAHQGKDVFIRLVDEASGGWGHINFDDFRLHQERPIPVTPPANANALVADEYPLKGVAAGPAAEAMKVPSGFRVLPAAAEPDVKQPIAMALDDRGRVWIAEAYEYPVRAKGEQGRDRIIIFEDTNGDGTLDQRKVFAEGLNLVSGIEVGFGGVWVGAAPYLMFLADKNQDDVADGAPQILLDGWGYQDTHETLNTFIWGPDGWLYGCHGVFTHSRVGKPGTPDDQRIPINAGIWRYHPTRHVFEVFAHGTSNPWGVDFNDHGQAFLTACVIPHLYHVIQGGRYQRQAGTHFNPYTYNDIKTIADHFHYLGARPHGGNGKSDAAGGGHAHAGAMVYLGGTWPELYRNKLFMNNIHGQRLNMDVMVPKGSGYVGSHGPDFLLTGDQASQILNLRYGPDGQCWMIDWYDMQACHLTDASRHDRSNGRIYKIVHGELKSVRVDLATYSDQQLAELTLHPNDWYVRHGRRLLQQRAAAGKVSSDAIAFLRKTLRSHPEDTRRLRAAWALASCEQLDIESRDAMLKDQSPYVRGWGIQLSLNHGAEHPLAKQGFVSHLEQLAEQDAEPVVQLYLASAAGRLPHTSRWKLLQALVSHASNANDHNLPLLIWYAAEPLAETSPSDAIAFAIHAGPTLPLIRDYMLRRVGARGDASAVSTLTHGLEQTNDPAIQLAFLEAIRSSLTGQRTFVPPANWSAISSRLMEQSDSRIRSAMESLGATFGDERVLATLRSRVSDKTLDPAIRQASLTVLLTAKDAKLPEVLGELLDDADLRSAALAGLAQYDEPRTTEWILKRYTSLGANEKRIALATLAARPSSAIAMLHAVESKQIPPQDLSADLVRQLQFLKSEEVRELLSRTWGRVRETAADKLKLIEHYRQVVLQRKGKPDLEHGRAVFARTCQQCHALFGTGGIIGPDLTGSNRTNLDYILSNIVDPSSVMAKEYQPTVLLTSDGRVVTGLIKQEDDKFIKIQSATTLEVIPKTEIEERSLSDQSMMPEDQLKQFSDDEVINLIGYLAAVAQVPMLADEKNVGSIFNGKDLAGWHGTEGLWSVEQGELVGRTEGLKQNEFLISELSAQDFKLTFEVRLVGNRGNSGVQFRSVPQTHGVKGYQADIGVGWWGKLYEEEGRGLLWTESGEKHVKPDDWNTYEIIAQGNQIETRINGERCVYLEDVNGARRGIFALQLHSGGETEVRYRNFRLEVK